LDNALFQISADGVTFMPNRKSDVNPDHLSYFRFVGRLIGMAIYHEYHLDIRFPSFIYKEILGLPMTKEDLQYLDPEFHKNLNWILENNIENIDLDLHFTTEHQIFGNIEQIELKPGGSKIPVQENNKTEYVNLMTQYFMKMAIADQLDSILKGLYEMIPKCWLGVFNVNELELLTCGLPCIDLEDWEKNTLYVGYSVESPQIKWFWKWLKSLSTKDQVAEFHWVDMQIYED